MKPLTHRQREACLAALAAMGAGERSRYEGHTEWPMHVTRRDIEGAISKLAGGAPGPDPLAVAAREIEWFATHRGGCAFIDGPAGSICDCGLDDAREALLNALADE